MTDNGKTIRVSQNTHSTFFSMIKRMKVKSSDECLKVLMIDWFDNHKSIDETIFRGMYQIEEKS